MTARGFSDLAPRLYAWPSRLWCLMTHRRLWKVWRQFNAHHGGAGIEWRCRLCGASFVFTHPSRRMSHV